MTAAPLAQRDLFTRRWRKLAEPAKEVTSLHIPLVAMLRWCVRPDVIWRHVPNGEHRDPRTAAKLKAMGILPGSADLEFFWQRYWQDQEGLYSELRVLFLELKLPRRKPSEAQDAFALAAKMLGAEYHVATSIDEAINLLGERGLIKSNVEVCGRRW
jgi:hypothetical protein